MRSLFSDAIKRVQVIDNEVNIFKPGDIEIKGMIVRDGS